uniref:Uncharacterized protein n=1 Tax=Cacopsylla melanoneura TaxID=428564 RepID=A0A8D8MAN0_9HEMI
MMITEETIPTGIGSTNILSRETISVHLDYHELVSLATKIMFQEISAVFFHFVCHIMCPGFDHLYSQCQCPIFTAVWISYHHLYKGNVPYLLCGSPMATYTKSMSHIYCVDLLSSIVCTRSLNVGLS